MARTIKQVQDSIITDMATYPELAPLLANTSKRSIWYLFIYVIAGAIVLLEQLMDTYRSNVETIVAQSASSTPLWLQDKISKFQYDASTPQIVKLDVAGGTFAPIYDVVNPALRIVTKTSINTSVANYVTIKVAKTVGGSLTALSSPETDSLQGYVNTIGTAGINYIVTSAPANQIYWKADITYDAQYASQMLNNLNASMTNYLNQIPFDGIFRVNQFESYILSNTQGIIDLVTDQLWIREDSQAVNDGIKLVVDGDVVRGNFNPTAGYIIPETTSGYGILDSDIITLIAY